MKRSLLMLALAVALPTAPVLADKNGGEQASARSNVRNGGALTSRQIEAIVLPKMRGKNYIGFTYYPVENIYRLRFLEGIQAIDVDVDARTGRIISRSR
ncbi:hypothetical protein B2G71_20715 [Novosphingobium sp. PC22D]|uniref:hypothetical protein n=1 Tax=Novosphingobium sp. PC22D TaxID=1962403 RepID=UPI000BFAE7DB|nr:hypothetical protein [Novosphingobium sp. PC22D]PEQ10774.1 hypothetical protein B2G71_20715 [Novosphingobium sp. PC22D]